MRRMMMTAAMCAVLAAGCGGKGPSEKAQTPTPTGPLASIQTGIFTPRCATQDGCHRGVSAAGGLDLTAAHAYENLVNAKATRRPDRLRVSPGHPESSYLVERLTAAGDTPQMPMGGTPLTPQEEEQIRSWIRSGAPR